MGYRFRKKLQVAGVLTAGLALAGFTLFEKHFDNYFPLQEKLSLEYVVIRLKPDGVREEGTLKVTNQAAAKWEGKPVVPRSYEIRIGQGAPEKYVAYFQNDREGILFVALQPGKADKPQAITPPFYYLKGPLKPGTTWGGGDGPRGSVEHAAETVTVPAGTFKGCVRVKLTYPEGKPLKEGIFWYAEKVGIVKSSYLYHNSLKEEFRLTAVKE